MNKKERMTDLKKEIENIQREIESLERKTSISSYNETDLIPYKGLLKVSYRVLGEKQEEYEKLLKDPCKF